MGVDGSSDATATTRGQAPAIDGLRRQRVVGTLEEAVTTHPLTLLVAPAGAGKTTALAQFTRESDRHAVWCRASAMRADLEGALGQVATALSGAVEGLRSGWRTVEDAAGALSAVSSQAPTLLVIDDLQELAQAPAERAMARLSGALPSWLRMIAATRHAPGFDHGSLKRSGLMLEISQDVLRWRTWEVERLFREFYRMRLRPEEAARLTERTEGWVAGLQLFSLASHGLPMAERERLIDELHIRPGLVRDYLTQNVLTTLSDPVRSFLIDTCVLGRVDPVLCDQLRGRHDSAEILSGLIDKRLFLIPREDGQGYRYHEVLRAYLDQSLLERDGAAETRARFHRAAQLLESDGSVPEALHAYARAEAWKDAARLLGSDGARLAREHSAALAALPPALVQADPWLRLARARALVGDGQLRPALAAYREAEEAFGHLPAADTCRHERARLAPWVDASQRPSPGTIGLLLAAARGEPQRNGGEAASRGSARSMVVAAACFLLNGSVDAARRLARTAGSRPDAGVFTIAAARVLEQAVDLACGQDVDTAEILWAADTLEQLGAAWLARLARTLWSCRTSAGQQEVLATADVLDADDDPWGPPLLRLVASIAAVSHGRPERARLAEAARDLRVLGAEVLAAWAAAWEALALAQLHRADALTMAQRARSQARHAVVDGAEAVTELAIAASDPDQAERATQRARGLARDLGLVALQHLTGPNAGERPAPGLLAVRERRPSWSVRCFGGLQLRLAGRAVATTGLKPQSHTLLAFLAMRAGRPVHRERLTELLWPEESATTARRRLPVLISTVRRHLEPDVASGDWTVLVRDSDAYVLRVPDETPVDTHQLVAAARAARRARLEHDTSAEMAAHQRVMATYAGELLPEFGAADWVVEDRAYFRSQVVGAAKALAAFHLGESNAGACIDTARAGLQVDRYHSQLWRLLADAHRSVGDVAAVARVEDEHAAVLVELGIEPGTVIDPMDGAHDPTAGATTVSGGSTA